MAHGASRHLPEGGIHTVFVAISDICISGPLINMLPITHFLPIGLFLVALVLIYQSGRVRGENIPTPEQNHSTSASSGHLI